MKGIYNFPKPKAVSSFAQPTIQIPKILFIHDHKSIKSAKAFNLRSWNQQTFDPYYDALWIKHVDDQAQSIIINFLLCSERRHSSQTLFTATDRYSVSTDSQEFSIAGHVIK